MFKRSVKSGVLIVSAIVLGVLLTLPLIAQAPGWSCRIHLPPNPYSFHKEDLEKLMWIEIANGEKEPTPVYLHGEIKRDGKLVARANSNRIEIPPGGKKITRGDITKLTDEWWDPELEKTLIRAPVLPEGKYEACVYVYRWGGKELLTRCCISFESKPISPPRLIAPKDGATLKEKYPLFQWTPPTPTPPGVTYNFRIVEVPKGMPESISEEELIRCPTIHEEKGITRTTFKYPLSARNLEKGKRYAWQVIAFSDKQKIGKSEIWMFTVQEMASLPTSCGWNTTSPLFPVRSGIPPGAVFFTQVRSGGAWIPAYEIPCKDADWGGAGLTSCGGAGWGWDCGCCTEGSSTYPCDGCPWYPLYDRGACWVSRDDSIWCHSTGAEEDTFRHVFTIPAGMQAQNARIWILADDSVHIFLNSSWPLTIGSPGYIGAHFGFGSPPGGRVFDLPDLSSGTHTLYFILKNTRARYYGFIYGVDYELIEAETCECAGIHPCMFVSRRENGDEWWNGSTWVPVYNIPESQARSVWSVESGACPSTNPPDWDDSLCARGACWISIDSIVPYAGGPIPGTQYWHNCAPGSPFCCPTCPHTPKACWHIFRRNINLPDHACEWKLSIMCYCDDILDIYVDADPAEITCTHPAPGVNGYVTTWPTPGNHPFCGTHGWVSLGTYPGGPHTIYFVLRNIVRWYCGFIYAIKYEPVVKDILPPRVDSLFPEDCGCVCCKSLGDFCYIKVHVTDSLDKCFCGIDTTSASLSLWSCGGEVCRGAILSPTWTPDNPGSNMSGWFTWRIPMDSLCEEGTRNITACFSVADMCGNRINPNPFTWSFTVDADSPYVAMIEPTCDPCGLLSTDPLVCKTACVCDTFCYIKLFLSDACAIWKSSIRLDFRYDGNFTSITYPHPSLSLDSLPGPRDDYILTINLRDILTGWRDFSPPPWLVPRPPYWDCDTLRLNNLRVWIHLCDSVPDCNGAIDSCHCKDCCWDFVKPFLKCCVWIGELEPEELEPEELGPEEMEHK